MWYGEVLAAGSLVVLALTGCGREASLREATGAPAVGQAAASGRVTLTDLATMCAAPTDTGPGIAVVSTELRDANRSIELPDCIIHLERGADVTLNNVTITGGTINIHDRATEPSSNGIRLQRVTMRTAALLVELNDVDDSFKMEATSVTTAQGIGIRVAGTHDGGNDGGSISLVGSSLLATDADATIHVLASEHTGEIRLVNTTVDTQGPLTVLAAACSAQLQGERLDCSTTTVSAELDG